MTAFNPRVCGWATMMVSEGEFGDFVVQCTRLQGHFGSHAGFIGTKMVTWVYGVAELSPEELSAREAEEKRTGLEDPLVTAEWERAKAQGARP